MQELLREIQNYINYLTGLGLNISIHFKSKTLKNLSAPVFSSLLAVNNHNNPYCLSIKRNGLEKCLQCQVNIIEDCSKKRAFFNCCYAGVLEYIQGIYIDGVSVGYVAASGYRDRENPLNMNELWKSSLQQEVPEKLLQILLPPLAIMVETLFQFPARSVDSEYNQILQYINEHYRELTLDQLCSIFSKSRSYISHLFNKNNSRSFRAYCNLLKLQDAQQLLLHTNMSITQIAYETGFCDTSYFIQLFKNEFCETPYKFRKKRSAL